MAEQMVHLRFSDGTFFDPETHWGLDGTDKKPLPRRLGKLTREWLSAGGIIPADQPQKKRKKRFM